MINSIQTKKSNKIIFGSLFWYSYYKKPYKCSLITKKNNQIEIYKIIRLFESKRNILT